MEKRISEKIREKFISKIALMKSDMIVEIVRDLGGVRRHMGSDDGYEEFVEDFEVIGSSGKDRTDHVERPVETMVGQFARPRSQLKLKHKMEVSNLLGTLTPKDLIDWIGEFEDYIKLEDIEDLIRVMLAKTKLKGHVALWWKEL